MGGAPNHRAFCSQASRFAFLDREGGCHQLCCFRFLARKCKNRPRPSGGRRGQARQRRGVGGEQKNKNEMKTSPPQGLCGTDRWLSQAAPPLRPLNVVGVRTPPGPPGRGQDCLPLRGLPQLVPRSSTKWVPGEGARGRGLRSPTAPAESAEVQFSGHRAPSGYGRGNPTRPPPGAHGPCRAAGPGRAPRRDSAGYTWCRRTGPRPPSCSSVSSTAARAEAGPYGEVGRCRCPGRGLLLRPLPLP